MKRFAALFILIFVCLSYTVNFAQSRRPLPSESGKVNRRDPKPVELPAPTPSVDEIVLPEYVQPAIDDGEILRVDTELVTVPVKILDRKNRLIGGLSKENFQIYEDGVQQEIAFFSNENQPFTVALILDMSYSTTFKIAEIQSAATAFISQLREKDQVMVVSFDREIHLLCNPTSDRKIIQAAIKKTSINYGTSLYDAVDLVINERLRKISGRKAVVLFTDGVDTTSSESFALKNSSDAAELDALIYPVQYDTFNDVQGMKDKPVIAQKPASLPKTFPTPPTAGGNPFPFPIPAPNVPGAGTMSSQGTSEQDYRNADAYLEDLATRTGGQVYKASTTANLTLAFSRIAAELREFYSLGYYPKTQSKEGKRRKIKVRVDQPNTVVRARDEYVVRKSKADNAK